MSLSCNALYVSQITVGEDKKKRRKKKKKRESVARRQSQLRQAKAYVISVLGEFARACWCKQVMYSTPSSIILTYGIIRRKMLTN